MHPKWNFICGLCRKRLLCISSSKTFSLVISEPKYNSSKYFTNKIIRTSCNSGSIIECESQESGRVMHADRNNPELYGTQLSINKMKSKAVTFVKIRLPRYKTLISSKYQRTDQCVKISFCCWTKHYRLQKHKAVRTYPTVNSSCS